MQGSVTTQRDDMHATLQCKPAMQLQGTVEELIMELGQRWREHAGNAGSKQGCELSTATRSPAVSHPHLTQEELRHLFQVGGFLLGLC
jgi:hypothetical protein